MVELVVVLGVVLPSLLTFILVMVYRKCILSKLRGTPEDRTPLPAAEEEELVAALQGEWDIIATGVPKWLSDLPAADASRYRSRRTGVQQISFTKAFVKGYSYTLQGGASGRTQTEEFEFYRGTWADHPSGPQPNALFVDKLGSVMTTCAPSCGVIEVNNALNVDIMWRRPAGWRPLDVEMGGPQPNCGQVPSTQAINPMVPPMVAADAGVYAPMPTPSAPPAPSRPLPCKQF
eukprot:TRINITY_DN43_c0_g2_i1.p1 TRINITY_DN43_c0_g2~~TRINITY_DN43_c0_g2_i1.p1  ORF type:complete len:233 (+),score=31.22 TRINITY_DN43_c0_g2_i1:57-755(+)